MDSEMFCFQCQETSQGIGCTLKKGVCGKDSATANMMDLLMFVTKGVCIATTEMRNHRDVCGHPDEFVTNALFSTITNANFDIDSIRARVETGLKLRNHIVETLKQSYGVILPAYDQLTWNGSDFEEKAKKVGVLSEENVDLRSLKELITYGLKGIAAYMEHAMRLGYNDKEVHAFMQCTLASLVTEKSVEKLLALSMETGKIGIMAMALLDKANVGTYGNPEITKVNLTVGNRPGILITGHDYKDMEELLKQTDGSGVDVYTHGEMWSSSYYPAFKKYKHLIGNYGQAWWQQREDFATFNGPVLFTTNCIVPPLEDASYKYRIFTTNETGYPGWKHIETDINGHKDFSEIITLAKTCQAPEPIEEGEVIGGFAHNQVMLLADKIVDAIKAGAIRKFYMMGGCDGRQRSREYYTEFAKSLPKDTVILTSGCAKYRYIKLNLGNINGIPRVLDAGQCNDSYSWVVIAQKLQEVFKLDDINKLPIVFNIGWYEQKAVIVLLALLSLGIKNIYIGPTLPGFVIVSPNVTKVLVEQFGLGTISTVEHDLNLTGAYNKELID
jgi:hydroxylamine reductase